MPYRTPAPSNGQRPIDRRDLAMRAFATLGLLFSAMLLVDYLHAPVFCGDHASGCDAVRHSVYARMLGVPLPVYGTLFFATILAAASWASEGSRRALAVLGGVGAFAGVAFVAIQMFAVHAFCKLCLVVDASALGAGVTALLLARDEGASLSSRGRGATAVAALLAVLVPLGYGYSRPAPERPANTPVIAELPEVIAREQHAGLATIVEFVDFECPFCRRQQAALAPVLASYGGRVRLIRRNVPLPFHEHARDAARAACCAEEQGRGERMSESLFVAEDLTPAGCEAAARRIGLDMAAYGACLASRRPDVLIERDHNDARAAGVGGLPTLWIGREKFEGLTDEGALRASIDRALRASTTPAASPAAPRSGT